jgi:hypothetical protein
MKNLKRQKTIITRKNIRMRKGTGAKQIKSHLKMILKDQITREL